MNGEPDERQRIEAFFTEVYADETPPHFKEMLVRRPAPDFKRWAPVAAALTLALGAGLMLWQVRPGPDAGAPAPSPEELELARSLSDWRAPLDFLLLTPGSELLSAPPHLTDGLIHLPEIIGFDDEEVM